MSKFTDIIIPQETVNDDTVIIADWHVADGERVNAGQLLTSIETSKAILEIEAEVDGFLEILQPLQAEVAIGTTIGRIHAQKLSTNKAMPEASSKPNIATELPKNNILISKKAQLLIDKHGIDINLFKNKEMVREKDVTAYLENAQQAVEKPVEQTIPTDSQQTPMLAEPQYEKKGFLYDAKIAAKNRGKNIFWLAWNYFWHNWLLGNLVRWAPRGLIIPCHRWRGVTIGDDCFIDPSAILETAFPENISLGNDVRIAAHAVIMSHIKPPHYLVNSGMIKSVNKPVILEDYCFIGVNAVIMPGVRIGCAAVVASGAVVLSDVAPYTMVAGNPAKTVKQFR
ncbi:MAG: biotin/lipoyl-containing protein [Pseudomonadota bacterium]